MCILVPIKYCHMVWYDSDITPIDQNNMATLSADDRPI